MTDSPINGRRTARILFLNPSGSLGGGERCLLDLVASIRSFRADDAVVLGLVAGSVGPLLAEAEALGVRVVSLPLSDRLATVGDSALVSQRSATAWPSFALRLGRAGFEVPAYAAKLAAAVRDFAPTIVHSNGIKMHLLGAAIGPSAPLVWHIRDFIGDRPLVSKAMRAVASRARVAIADSHAVAEDARRVMPRLRVSVIHEAIDTTAFSPNGPAADLDALAGCERGDAGVLRVGFVGTYARWKGHDVFLQAVSRLKAMEGLPNLRFYIIGGAIYDTAASQYTEGELRALVEQLGIGDRVRFVPFQTQVDAVYRAVDMVVHASSRREPFGRTIAEAMATGKPTIASKESGAAELFTHGVDAILTPSRDPDALAEALRGLVMSRRRRETMGEEARKTAVERFSRERLTSQLSAVYREAGCAALSS